MLADDGFQSECNPLKSSLNFGVLLASQFLLEEQVAMVTSRTFKYSVPIATIPKLRCPTYRHLCSNQFLLDYCDNSKQTTVAEHSEATVNTEYGGPAVMAYAGILG